MIELSDKQTWTSLQDHNSYRIVLVGPTFVRLKSVDNEDHVFTIDKARLYEWFFKEAEEEDSVHQEVG